MTIDDYNGKNKFFFFNTLYFPKKKCLTVLKTHNSIINDVYMYQRALNDDFEIKKKNL